MFKNIEWGKLWNHGGSMFATFWIVIALYALGGYLVWAFLQLDAEFSRPLAGGVVPDEVTQQIAWGTRAFSVIAGSVAIYFAAHNMKGWKWFFTTLTAIAALILLVHAYGIASKIMQGQFDADEAIGEVATIDKGAIQAEIDDLIAERDGLPALTDTAVATFQRSIDSITNDGLDNDDEAQEFADKQVAAIEARDKRLGEIRTELSEKRAELRGTSSTEIEDKADSDSFNPLFVFGSRLTSKQWDPSEDPSTIHAFIWGMAFFTVFFGFGEVLMMACFTGGYAVLKLRSMQKLTEDEKPNDPNFVTLPQIEGEGYWETRIAKALKTRIKKPTAQGIKDTYFDGVATIHELRSQLQLRVKRGLLSQRDFDFIMREGQWAPKPKQDLNGTKPNGADDANGQDPVNNLPA